MSSDPFDDLDRALASGLSALAPDVAGGDVALAELRPRFERARTRRRVAFAGGLLGMLAALGTAAALAAPGTARTHVEVAVPSSLPVSTTRPHPTTTHRATSTTLPPPTTTTPTTVATASAPPRPHRSAPAPAPGTTPAFAPPTSGAPTVSRAAAPSSTTTTTAPRDTKTYWSRGGSIVVRSSRTGLTLVGVSPAPGYSAAIRDRGPERIDVRFDSAHDESRIILAYDGGHVVQSNYVRR